jgi:hypothetical protein
MVSTYAGLWEPIFEKCLFAQRIDLVEMGLVILLGGNGQRPSGLELCLKTTQGSEEYFPVGTVYK